ncbi:hypothetical protein [Bradyrhizobium sp. CCGB20]|uniref:hypothetical protein n=1 Tax=Bradyrhizobium sp. CCGB20 TaxID=2949633 RepID=UPI0020B37528|nr:hypothetical protein [Bradyrhizobium sp. CCGB20]MCP3396984.1 hypothetical protein [Bradyrhizobium sp. CCGB20]
MISFIQENDLLIAFSPLRFRLFELDMPTYERLRASNYFALQRRGQNTERCRDADKNGARGLMSDGLLPHFDWRYRQCKRRAIRAFG